MLRIAGGIFIVILALNILSSLLLLGLVWLHYRREHQEREENASLRSDSVK